MSDLFTPSTDNAADWDMVFMCYRISRFDGGGDGNEDVTQAKVTISDDDTAACAFDHFDSHIFVPSARFIKMTKASRFIQNKWLFISSIRF